MTKPVIVLTTVGGSFDAPELARVLVEQRLAACVNIVERIRSIYRWQGKVEDDVEQLLIIKTVDEQLHELKEVLFLRHPYEVPEFVVLEIDRIEGPYLEWLLESMR
ncbi:MAG TPA: divalent-cation tolerance protein CutA [Thermoanaerobaculia bacterium]|nr:divalent-cation tolerance protein CutA [Thermoanaerobaculia bacterium]